MKSSSRRNFLKKVGIGVGAVTIAGVAGTSVIAGTNQNRGKRLNYCLPMELLLRLIKRISSLQRRLWKNLRLKPGKDCQTGNS